MHFSPSFGDLEFFIDETTKSRMDARPLEMKERTFSFDVIRTKGRRKVETWARKNKYNFRVVIGSCRNLINTIQSS